MRGLLLLCLLLLLSGCGPDHESLAGRYHARRDQSATPPAVYLVLEEDGSGSWTVQGGVEMPFSWSQEQDKVVLRTKTGGILAGKRQGDAIILQLPGSPTMTFVPKRQ